MILSDGTSTNGVLNLNFSGMDTIRSLFADGEFKPIGKYGAVDDVPNMVTGLPGYITGSGILEVTALPAPPGVDGDYNDDGVVDAADYVVWRKLTPNASSGLPAHDATPTTVGSDDYDTWVENFGDSESGAGNNAPVPEPTTCLSLLIAAAFAAIARRRS